MKAASADQRGEPFDVVRRGYDSIGARYRDRSAPNEVRRQWVERLMARLSANSLVLDLGCGSGEPATRRLAQAHRVIGVDASFVQLILANLAAPSALLVQADMTRLSLRPGSVDAITSFYALGHVPSERHAPLFRTFAEWLRPGGLVLASTPAAAGDGVEADWLGVEMFFGGLGEEATRLAVEQAGLRIDTFEPVPEDEGNGVTVCFNWLIATKP